MSTLYFGGNDNFFITSFVKDTRPVETDLLFPPPVWSNQAKRCPSSNGINKAYDYLLSIRQRNHFSKRSGRAELRMSTLFFSRNNQFIVISFFRKHTFSAWINLLFVVSSLIRVGNGLRERSVKFAEDQNQWQRAQNLGRSRVEGSIDICMCGVGWLTRHLNLLQPTFSHEQ